MIKVFLLSLTLLLSFGFSLNDYQKKPKTLYNLRQIVSQYPEEKIVKNVREFVSCCRPGRLVGTDSHNQSYEKVKSLVQRFVGEHINIVDQEFKPDVDHAMMFYRDQLELALAGDFKREDERFQKLEHFANQRIGLLEKLRDSQGKNLIWEKRGAKDDNEVLILMAHYDNAVFKQTEKGKVVALESQMPGADKNASGVALLISLAEILNEVELPKTVRLIFLDFGEFESLGAKAYIENWKKHQSNEKVAGAINVMMVGHSSKNNHDQDLEHDMRLYYRPADEGESQDQKWAKMIKELGDQMGSPINAELERWERPAGGQRYFWQAEIPAFLYSHNWEEDANPRIHTSNDFVETLNFKTLHGNLRYLSGSVLAWAFDLE